jgi:hypothetical protein
MMVLGNKPGVWWFKKVQHFHMRVILSIGSICSRLDYKFALKFPKVSCNETCQLLGGLLHEATKGK